MSYLNDRSYRTLLIISVLVVVSGCGGSSTSGRWLESADAQGVYEADIRITAITSGDNPDPFQEVNTTCEAVLGEAQEDLDDPGDNVEIIQVIARPCTNAGLEFQNEVRCETGRLQALCQ